MTVTNQQLPSRKSFTSNIFFVFIRFLTVLISNSPIYVYKPLRRLKSVDLAKNNANCTFYGNPWESRYWDIFLTKKRVWVADFFPRCKFFRVNCFFIQNHNDFTFTTVKKVGWIFRVKPCFLAKNVGTLSFLHAQKNKWATVECETIWRF